MDALETLLSSEIAPFEPLPAGEYVIYGAGNIGREVAAVLKESGRTVRAFIDARATGEIGGVPIHAPNTSEARKLASVGLPVVIGIFNYTVDPIQIHELLKEIGFSQVFSFYQFQEQFNLGSHFWLTGRAHLLQHRDKLRACWSLLADEASREVFLNVLRLRLTYDFNSLRQPTYDQYWPDGLPMGEKPIRLVDGGAFDGDTIELLRGRGLSFGAIAAFEPDDKNFQKLKKTVEKHLPSLGDVTLWPCGMGEKAEFVRFTSGLGMGSAVDQHGESFIQIVTVDDVLPAFAPTYIKLDIEGFEMAALQGAAESIRRHQPAVAVCIYHKPDDLWQLPLYLAELLPSHRVYLRYHAFQGFELVAYVLPA